MNLPLGFLRECDLQRVRDHGLASVAELEQAAEWIPVRGYEFSGDAIAVLRRRGFFE